MTQQVPDEEYEQIAELLIAIGWKSTNDAQWSQLRDAIPKLREILKPQSSLSDLPRRLPETMERDDILNYYSSFSNLVSHESMVYQKQIRDLEAIIAKLIQLKKTP